MFIGSTKRYMLCRRVAIHVKASLCKITYVNVCTCEWFHWNILDVLEGKTHSRTSMFYKFHILNKPTWLTEQPGHSRSIRRHLRSLVLMHVIIYTRKTLFVTQKSSGSTVPTPFHRIQTAATVQPWLPSHFLSSLFLTLTCLFAGLYFNLFMAFHVLHSCAPMSPDPWPRP